MLVVQSSDKWKKREWADFVKFFDILVNIRGFKRLVNFLDVGNELEIKKNSNNNDYIQII
jgi:hypothetical protein